MKRIMKACRNKIRRGFLFGGCGSVKTVCIRYYGCESCHSHFKEGKKIPENSIQYGVNHPKVEPSGNSLINENGHRFKEGARGTILMFSLFFIK